MRRELSYLETVTMIDEIKDFFERQLESRLSLRKIQSPLFIKRGSELQDTLIGTEKVVSFTKENEKFEIVHSLKKWKRNILGQYEFPLHTGLYTDRKFINRDENVDEIHSLFIEQWDFEKVICKEDRTIEYLKETVKSVYKSIRQTSIFVKQKYHFITIDLPKTITFVTSQELEDLYPDRTPREREDLITREKKAVFIIGIGDKLKSDISHDLRDPGYDDWSLNGDMFIYNKIIDKAVEITSMGISVDEKSLIYQLKKTNCLDRLNLSYYQKIQKCVLPYTIGGSIGQSRIFMLLLEKSHIAEVQASSWDEKTLGLLQDKMILK